MTNRIITVVLEIENTEEAKVLWSTHLLQQKLIAGCKVVSISNGDCIKALNAVDNIINTSCDHLADEIEDAIKDIRGY